MQKPCTPPSCEECHFLSQCLVGSLDKKMREVISQKKHALFYKKNATLFYEKDPVFGLHVLRQGFIKKIRHSNGGRENIIGLVTPGQSIGLRHINSHLPYTYSSITVEDSSLCFLEITILKEYLTNSPSMSRHLCLLLGNEIQEMEDANQRMMSRSARHRTANFLLSLKGKTPNKQSGDITFSLSRHEMASMIGMATETFIRLLTDLKREGVIKQNEKFVTIIDEDKLNEIALSG